MTKISQEEQKKLAELEAKERDLADLYFTWPSDIKLHNYNKATKEVREFREKYNLNVV